MKALEGLRMLDLTHMVSGPYAALLLADSGVETIKIEPPGQGEITRRLLADNPNHSLDGMGAYFLALNRNKKSLTLNLKQDEGLALFYELVKKSDIVLNNFSVGVPEKLKIDYAHLSQINPRIITCSVTGFGETGPEKHRVAYDIVAQAMGGGMSVTGHPDSPPVRAGLPFGDLAGGMMGVIGILAAVIARETTGCGQHIDISMLDTQISLLTYMATAFMLSGELPERRGNAHFLHVPYNSFRTQDGYIILAVITDAFWENLMQIVDAPDLNTTENQHQPGRWKNQHTINNRLEAIFCTQTQAYWIERLSAARIPCAPVNSFAQALSDVQVLARNMVVEIAHPGGQTTRAPGNPVKMSATYEDTFDPPPLLGQHTNEILKTLLGLPDSEIQLLKEKGVV
ncbi:MAG: CoA transferase [Anaerolineae bacterium]|nr:CoA transferase [Anaerolineae bacterium]